MWNFLTKKRGSVKTIARDELNKNRAILESLRDYDAGKKDISTTNVRKHLRDLQTTV